MWSLTSANCEPVAEWWSQELLGRGKTRPALRIHLCDPERQNLDLLERSISPRYETGRDEISGSADPHVVAAARQFA
jgi:hypothetical protein